MTDVDKKARYGLNLAWVFILLIIFPGFAHSADSGLAEISKCADLSVLTDPQIASSKMNLNANEDDYWFGMLDLGPQITAVSSDQRTNFTDSYQIYQNSDIELQESIIDFQLWNRLESRSDSLSEAKFALESSERYVASKNMRLWLDIAFSKQNEQQLLQRQKVLANIVAQLKVQLSHGDVAEVYYLQMSNVLDSVKSDIWHFEQDEKLDRGQLRSNIGGAVDKFSYDFPLDPNVLKYNFLFCSGKNFDLDFKNIDLLEQNVLDSQSAQYLWKFPKLQVGVSYNWGQGYSYQYGVDFSSLTQYTTYQASITVNPTFLFDLITIHSRKDQVRKDFETQKFTETNDFKKLILEIQYAQRKAEISYSNAQLQKRVWAGSRIQFASGSIDFQALLLNSQNTVDSVEKCLEDRRNVWYLMLNLYEKTGIRFWDRDFLEH